MQEQIKEWVVPAAFIVQQEANIFDGDVWQTLRGRPS